MGAFFWKIKNTKNMKNYLIKITFIAVVLFFGISAFPVQQHADANKVFKVTIHQNGELQKIKNNKVTLKPGPFDIIVEFSEPMGVFANASYNKETYKLALKNTPIDKLRGFLETGIADARFNKEREIYIADEAPNYWYYDTDTDNRFNSVEKSGNKIICKRTVEKTFDTSTDSTINIADLDKTLYLVFMSIVDNDSTTDKKEIQRQCIAIKWKK
jgi:hypothetical protein